MIAEAFLIIIFMIPLYAFLIWAYSSPEDVISFGKKGNYQEEIEHSPNIIRYVKFTSVFTMIFSPIVLINLLFKPDVFGLTLLVLILGIASIGASVMLTAGRKSE